MNHKKLTLCIFLSFLSSANWVYSSNNPWAINMSSESSSIGGITLESYNYSDNELNTNKINIFNSTMFNGLIGYNNIIFTHKINKISILGNSFDSFKIGILNRKINNIPNTQYAWDQMLLNEPVLSDIDYDLIEYYDHKDVSLLAFIPFSNQYGSFGVTLRPMYSKINEYSAEAFNLDISYSNSNKNNFHFGLLFNNVISYKKWNTGYVEKVYPSLSTLLTYSYSDLSIFMELKNLYFDSHYLNNQFDFIKSINLGFEYAIYNELDLRMGFNSDFYTFGVGTSIYNILFDYTYLYHKDLDYSHQFTLSFLIKNQ